MPTTPPPHVVAVSHHHHPVIPWSPPRHHPVSTPAIIRYAYQLGERFGRNFRNRHRTRVLGAVQQIQLPKLLETVWQTLKSRHMCAA